MERKRHTTTPRIAVLIALIDLILIAFTLHKELPNVQLDFHAPFAQLLSQPGMWFNLAEMLFHSAGLIMVYGAISLLLPRLRFILWLGAGLANLAGIPYLISLVASYRSNQPGGNIQIALFMFLVCMILPFLLSRLFGLFKNS
jgi:hypothetical protein